MAHQQIGGSLITHFEASNLEGDDSQQCLGSACCGTADRPGSNMNSTEAASPAGGGAGGPKSGKGREDSGWPVSLRSMGPACWVNPF